MLKEYYEYVNEFVNEFRVTLAEYEEADSYEELYDFVERNADEIVASAVIYYGIFKFETFDQIFEMFQEHVFNQAPELFEQQTDTF